MNIIKNYISDGVHGRVRHQYFITKEGCQTREMNGKNQHYDRRRRNFRDY
jgi:hypothetical protein